MSLKEVTKQEIIKFFNSRGYVLDFSSNSFSEFTKHVIGEDLLKKYRLSKGSSLLKFIENGPDDKVIKLTNALLDYYKNVYHQNKNYNNPEYQHLRKIINNYKMQQFNLTDPFLIFLRSISGSKLGDDIRDDVTRLQRSCNVKDAKSIILTSDVIIGDVLKYILNSYDKLGLIKEQHHKLTLSVLSRTALKLLFPHDGKNGISTVSKRLTGSLIGVICGINLMRDKHSSAHSNSFPSDQKVSMPYALLCLRSAFTVIDFIVGQFYRRQKNNGSNRSNALNVMSHIKEPIMNRYGDSYGAITRLFRLQLMTQLFDKKYY